MAQHPAALIRRKRDGHDLDAAEVREFVQGVVDGTFGDAQLGAMLMAILLNGMTREETAALTLAMRDSGRVLRWRTTRPVVDKHSTGGVGDKVSLLLAPLVTAAGLAVPMISGRGLGHTGGTIDKLEAIPGYRAQLPIDEFQRVLDQGGYAMTSAGPEIAPADRRMYAVRDVSATVESLPLITASILSKKLAAGLQGLVMDVKCGRAAFLPRRHDAEALRESLVEVGREAGLRVEALLSDMDVPLGLAIGNAIEVAEVVAALQGGGPADLIELTLALGARMLLLGGLERDDAAARQRLQGLLADGSALAMFRRNLELQGGDPGIVDDVSRLGAAPVKHPVAAAKAGFVTDVDPLLLGRAVVDLGGGRRQPADAVDPLVGIVLARRHGEAVAAGEPLAVVHAREAAAAERAAAAVRQAMPVGRQPRPRGPVVIAG